MYITEIYKIDLMKKYCSQEQPHALGRVEDFYQFKPVVSLIFRNCPKGGTDFFQGGAEFFVHEEDFLQQKKKRRPDEKFGQFEKQKNIGIKRARGSNVVQG